MLKKIKECTFCGIDYKKSKLKKRVNALLCPNCDKEYKSAKKQFRIETKLEKKELDNDTDALRATVDWYTDSDKELNKLIAKTKKKYSKKKYIKEGK